MVTSARRVARPSEDQGESRARATTNAVVFRSRTIEAELDKRGESRGTAARRDLERYYQVIERELAGVDVSEREARVIVDALGSTEWTPQTVGLAWAAIGERDEALGQRVKALPLSATWALIDAAERAARAGGDVGARLRAAGLVKQ